MNAFAAAELDAELTAPGFEFFDHGPGHIYGEPSPNGIPSFPAAGLIRLSVPRVISATS